MHLRSLVLRSMNNPGQQPVEFSKVVDRSFQKRYVFEENGNYLV